MDHGGNEEYQEGHQASHQAHAATAADVFVFNIVHDIEDAVDLCEEHHRKSENDIPGVEQRIKTVARVGPVADDGVAHADEIVFGHHKVGTVEKRADGSTDEQWTNQTVDDEEPLEGLGAKQVALLVLEFIAHSLHHKGEEDDHPQPIGTAEAGAVEQWKRGEECSTKGD